MPSALHPEMRNLSYHDEDDNAVVDADYDYDDDDDDDDDIILLQPLTW